MFFAHHEDKKNTKKRRHINHGFPLIFTDYLRQINTRLTRIFLSFLADSVWHIAERIDSFEFLVLNFELWSRLGDVVNDYC